MQTTYKTGQKRVRILFRILIFPDPIPDPIPDRIPDPIPDIDGIPDGTTTLICIHSKLLGRKTCLHQ